MAATTRDYGWFRKNGRLESFLQRCLTEEFSRVSWYEPCVISSTYDKPTFRFVVVTDEHVYVTDNPPTELILIVRLGDVVRLEVINEYPQFLKGVARENVQHIKITSKDDSIGAQTTSSSSSSRRSISQLSDIIYRNDASSRASSRSASEPEIDAKIEKKWKWSRFLPSLLLNKKKCGLQTLVEDDTDSEPSSLNQGDDDAIVNINTKKRRKSIFKKFLLFHRDKVRCEIDIENNETLPPSPITNNLLEHDARDNQFLNYTPEYLNRPESVPVAPHQFLSVDEKSDITLQLRSPTISAGRYGRSQTALGNYADHKYLGKKRGYRRSLSDNQENSSSSPEYLKKIPKQPTELHLYILTAQSSIFRHLMAAWNRILVRLTVRLENGQFFSNNTSPREHLEQSLLEVSRRLSVVNEDDFVHSRILVDSLQKDLSNSSLARKLFWKDPQLFPTAVEKLQLLVLASDCIQNPTIGVIMDKLKLAASIVMMLTTVLQEIQILPERTSHLTSKNAQKTQELLGVLISEPWIPTNYQNIILTVVSSHEQLLSHDWDTLPEAPLIRSLKELTNACTAALYQFIQLAYQEKELITNQKSYGIPWIVKFLSEQQHLEKYISRLMCQILSLAIPSSTLILTPTEAVLLHQQLTVLLILVTYSPGVADHIHLNYAEEFRYYIFSHVISEKVPDEYPVRPNILTLVDDVRHQILDVKLFPHNSPQFITVL